MDALQGGRRSRGARPNNDSPTGEGFGLHSLSSFCVFYFFTSLSSSLFSCHRVVCSLPLSLSLFSLSFFLLVWCVRSSSRPSLSRLCSPLLSLLSRCHWRWSMTRLGTCGDSERVYSPSLFLLDSGAAPSRSTCPCRARSVLSSIRQSTLFSSLVRDSLP